MVTTLRAGPRCVTELAALIGLSQSCTTRHLQALERQGIVVGERHGKRVFFGLKPDALGLHPVLRWAVDDDSSAGSDSKPASGSRRARSRTQAGVNSKPAESAESADQGESLMPGLAPEHESGWRAADRPSVSDQGLEGENGDTARERPPGPAPRIAEVLDDFLL